MKKKNLPQQVADRLYELIVRENKYKPGDQLPGELILCEEIGVSRATLREAIRILTTHGVLQAYRGKGTFVTADSSVFDRYGLSKLNATKSQLKDLFEARLLVEPEMSALACLRATEEELQQILNLGIAVEDAIRKGINRTESDQAFHQAIMVAAHNDFILQLYPIINNAIEEAIRFNASQEELAENTLRDHALLIDFLRKRDVRGAKQAMSIHLHHAIYTLGLNLDSEPIF